MKARRLPRELRREFPGARLCLEDLCEIPPPGEEVPVCGQERGLLKSDG